MVLIAERVNPVEWLRATMDEPEHRVALAHGREERQKVFECGGQPILLRVICEGDLVITALLTRKRAKYGASP